MDEQEILRRCIEGDSVAWGELVGAHAGRLFSFVRPMLPTDADAEDAAAAVFAKLWADGRRRLREFRGKSSLKTWVTAIARREAIDILRKKKPSLVPHAEPDESMFDRIASDIRSPEAAVEATDEIARLGRALARLPSRDRLLLRLIYNDGCSYEAAAKFIGAPLGSISSWIVRTKEQLRNLLTEKELP